MFLKKGRYHYHCFTDGKTKAREAETARGQSGFRAEPLSNIATPFPLRSLFPLLMWVGFFFFVIFILHFVKFSKNSIKELP